MDQSTPLASEYSFYTPPQGRAVTCGPQEEKILLPQIPLPLEGPKNNAEPPSDKLIGISLYNYLRRFPDCPHAAVYARLLQQAYPYYLSDIGAQIIMLEAKDVDAPYIRRKISYLKILALLEPDNPQLLQKIGNAYFELGMIYVELIHVRREFSHALNFLQRALQRNPGDTTTLNILGQISYLVGDYPAVQRYWQGVIDKIPDCDAKCSLQQRLAKITAGDTPQAPLVDDLETIGTATEHFAAGEFAAASEIMERLEEQNIIPTELPSPEFFYFLGICREKTAAQAAAFEAFSKALEIDPQHQAAKEGIDRVQQ